MAPHNGADIACPYKLWRANMLKPLHNYVLMEPVSEESKTAAGIIIPDNAKEKPSRGKVIAVGEGAFDGGVRVPMSVKAGDVVLFAKWASSANEIKLNGKDYILAKETDILGII
jgi:chaperonin GroES